MRLVPSLTALGKTFWGSLVLEHYHKRSLPLLLLLLALAAPIPPICKAQSLIVGIPSADVTPHKSFLVASESQFSNFDTLRKTKWNSFNFVTYGLNPNTELSLSLNNFSLPKTNNLSLGLGIKKVIPLFSQTAPNSQWKLTLGKTLPISLQGNGLFGTWMYSTLSYRLPKTKTRITAGVSGGTKQLFGRNTIHSIVGFEQPLSKRLSLVGDWYSGTHDLASFIPALQYTPKKNMIYILGVKLPNNARVGKPALMFEISRRIR